MAGRPSPGRRKRLGGWPPLLLLLLVLLLMPLASCWVLLLGPAASVAAAPGMESDEGPVEEEPAAVVDLEVDAWGDVVGLGQDKAAVVGSAGQVLSFPLAGEEGNWETFKSWRDVAAAENFTAMDYLSVRGAVLALTPDDSSTDVSNFPMCELFKIGAPLRLHCVMIALNMRGTVHTCVRDGAGGSDLSRCAFPSIHLYKHRSYKQTHAALTRMPPDVRDVSTERQPLLTVGGWGRRADLPPHQLKEPGSYPLPDFITDQAFIADEKPVYYWFYRQVGLQMDMRQVVVRASLVVLTFTPSLRLLTGAQPVRVHLPMVGRGRAGPQAAGGLAATAARRRRLREPKPHLAGWPLEYALPAPIRPVLHLLSRPWGTGRCPPAHLCDARHHIRGGVGLQFSVSCLFYVRRGVDKQTD